MHNKPDFVCMNSKKLKYSESLQAFPDCPKSHFKEIEGIFHRWVQEDCKGENDFLPMNKIKTPPQRMLDQTDQMCMGYGLSLFDTYSKAFTNYEKHYKKNKNKIAKQNFVTDKGSAIAAVTIDKEDGLADEPHAISGHFTFHEYLICDLTKKIQSIFNIFDSNGNFKMESGPGD